MRVGAWAVNLVLGVLLAGGVAWGAYRMRLLTRDGALGAVVVGASVFGLGGWQPSLLMVVFFFTSSLLPRVLGRSGQSERRNLWQVLANGGMPTLAVWLAFLAPAFAERAWLAYVASLACATGDTWATEIGIRYGRQPRLILTGAPVPPGTSGAVSLAGTLGALLGSGLIAGLGALGMGLSAAQFLWAWGAELAGVMLDSLLGASVQARFVCQRCQKRTESRVHCGVPAEWRSGWRWLDNNGVNALATLGAALTGFMGRF